VERDYRWGGRPAFARLDLNDKAREFSRNRQYGFFGESDVIHMMNFNVGMQWSEALSFNVFGQNLLNDRGFTGPETYLEYAPRARPRTYGVSFSVGFD
jgi:hypothetical protein